MNRLAMVILLAAVILAESLTAAETSVHGRLFSYWQQDLTDSADGLNDFGLDRAYVTVKSKLSDQAAIRITSDLRETVVNDDDDAKTRYYVIIKYGYLDWTPAFGQKKLKLRFGLQPTPYISVQNKLWGRRYLAKTVSDMNKFLTSSDAGVSAHVALGEKGKYGSLGLALFNGTSYTDLGELNKQKDLNLFGLVKPLTNSADLKKSAVVAQYYKGTRNVTFDDTTLAGDYQKNIFSVGANLVYRDLLIVGADLNWYTKGIGADSVDVKMTGLSFFGTLFLSELADGSELLRTLNLFGRYDSFDPDTDINNNAEKLLIIGVEYNPTKGFKASLNLRSTSYDDGRATEKQLFVNSLFKF